MADDLHPELDALAGALWDQSELSTPLVFVSDGEPPEHVRKLMRTLGVQVEVRPVPVRSSPRSAVNKQVRVGDGVGGEIVVLGAWCPTCKADSIPNRHGYCSFCGTLILDEDALSARAMRDQIAAEKVRPVEESHAPEPLLTAPDDAGGVGPEAVGTAAGTEGRAAVRSSDAPVDGTKKRRWIKWTEDAALERVREVAAQIGRPPMQRETKEHALPSHATARELFGCWANMIEAAGFERPTRGGVKREGVRGSVPRDGGGKEEGSGSGASSEVAKPEAPNRTGYVWLVKVPGTGLRYRTTDEALTAADEIEADGERVYKDAHAAGQNGKADQAIDAARALAEQIRAAARTAGATTTEPEPEAEIAGPGTAPHASPGPAATEPGSGSDSQNAPISDLLRTLATAIDAGLFANRANLALVFDGLALECRKREDA